MASAHRVLLASLNNGTGGTGGRLRTAIGGHGGGGGKRTTDEDSCTLLMSDCLGLDRMLDEASLATFDSLAAFDPFFFLRCWSGTFFVLLRFPRLVLVADRSESDTEYHCMGAGDVSLAGSALGLASAFGFQCTCSNAGSAAGALDEPDQRFFLRADLSDNGARGFSTNVTLGGPDCADELGISITIGGLAAHTNVTGGAGAGALEVVAGAFTSTSTSVEL